MRFSLGISLVVLGVLGMGTYLLVGSQHEQGYASLWGQGGSCQPYNLPGALKLVRNTPSETAWTTFDEGCQANNSLVEAFRSGAPLPWVDGKQIVLVGDSVDREMLRWLCKFPGGVIEAWELDDSTAVLDDAVVNKGYPRSCTFPDRDGLTLRSYHFCGIDYQGVWKDKSDPCIAPADFSTRWRDFEAYVSKLDKPVDYVTLNSGLWDLARFQREQYATFGQDSIPGLTPEFMHEWPVLAQEYVKLIRNVFPPSTPMAWRTIHNVRTKAGLWFQPPGGNGKLVPSPPFTDLRVHQMRALQKDLIRRNRLTEIAFGDVADGQDVELLLLDDIHPGEVGFSLMLEMLLDAVKRALE